MVRRCPRFHVLGWILSSVSSLCGSDLMFSKYIHYTSGVAPPPGVVIVVVVVVVVGG